MKSRSLAMLSAAIIASVAVAADINEVDQRDRAAVRLAVSAYCQAPDGSIWTRSLEATAAQWERIPEQTKSTLLRSRLDALKAANAPLWYCPKDQRTAQNWDGVVQQTRKQNLPTAGVPDASFSLPEGMGLRSKRTVGANNIQTDVVTGDPAAETLVGTVKETYDRFAEQTIYVITLPAAKGDTFSVAVCLDGDQVGKPKAEKPLSDGRYTYILAFEFSKGTTKNYGCNLTLLADQKQVAKELSRTSLKDHLERVIPGSYKSLDVGDLRSVLLGAHSIEGRCCASEFKLSELQVACLQSFAKAAFSQPTPPGPGAGTGLTKVADPGSLTADELATAIKRGDTMLVEWAWTDAVVRPVVHTIRFNK